MQKDSESLTLRQAFSDYMSASVRRRPAASVAIASVLIAVFLAIGVSAALQAPWVGEFNTAVNALVHGWRGDPDAFMIAITQIGNTLPMACIIAIIFLVLLALRRWRYAVFFGVNAVIGAAVVNGIKFLFCVARPTAPTLVPLPISYSFPSGHSGVSLIVFGLVGIMIAGALTRKGTPRPLAWMPFVLLVILAATIAISRIYVGVHWPTDILGGWCLAAALLILAVKTPLQD